MKKLFFITILLLLIPLAHAKSSSTVLLAVTETENGFEGSIADIYLEIKPGTGKVFIETYPFSRTDTQISAKSAKEIACRIAKEDCRKYDFFYTIHANSAMIAGPSAGASISVLTLSVIDGLEMDEKIAITGTINPGGLIGSVGGIKEKLDAAKKANLSLVLVPNGETVSRRGNITVDVKEYAGSLGIKIMEVASIEDAVLIITGKDYSRPPPNVIIDKSYTEKMKTISSRLCHRTEQMLLMSDRKNATFAALSYGKAKEAFEEEKFYTSASYCFGANLELKEDHMQSMDFEGLGLLHENLKKELYSQKNYSKDNIKNIQIYMVVTERIDDSREYLEDAGLSIERGEKELAAKSLSYAYERYESAKAWSLFFTNDAEKIEMGVIKENCERKLQEAEERLAYVTIVFPQGSVQIREGLKKAYDAYFDSDYAMCLFRSSKNKAESDVLISLMGYEINKTDDLIDKKIEMGLQNIEKRSYEYFPILAYSYNEYAKDLKHDDRASAFLYAEYAIELSDMEFKKRDEPLRIDPVPLIYSMLGLFLGLVLAFLFMRRKKSKALTSIR